MFLIINNDLHSGLQGGDTELLIGIVRELRCEYMIMKADAVVGPNGFEPFAGIVLSDGGLARDEEVSLSKFRANVQALLLAPTPILGIGTGARIIAEAYGAVVLPRAPADGDDTTLELMNQSVLFDFLAEAIRIKDDRTHVITEVPPQFESVATSARGAAYALQHRTRELYAMNFSVASAGDAGKVIVKNFLRYAGTASGTL
jgi:GMP synthase-like glutamine amidotransferase